MNKIIIIIIIKNSTKILFYFSFLPFSGAGQMQMENFA